MKSCAIRWFLAGFAVAIAAGAAGVVIAGLRRYHPATDEDAGTPTPMPELQPVP